MDDWLGRVLVEVLETLQDFDAVQLEDAQLGNVVFFNVCAKSIAGNPLRNKYELLFLLVLPSGHKLKDVFVLQCSQQHDLSFDLFALFGGYLKQVYLVPGYFAASLVIYPFVNDFVGSSA